MTEFNNIQRFHLRVLVPVILLFFIHFAISHCCHDHERDALLSFKSFLTDSSNRLSSWQVGRNCCNWDGIRCSHDSFHVVSVDLRNPQSYNARLNGTISPSLFNLTHLQYLDLSFNDFQSSKIPHQFANLKDLTYLNLSNSWFSGSITTQFANLSSLQYLDISCSYYYGVYDLSTDISWLRGLVDLKVLRLAGVDLSVASLATIHWAEPISFLSNLRQLDLSYCQISSPILVQEFRNNTRLSSLLMGSNNFLHSSIPVQLANLTSLSILDLTYSQLEGSISYLPQLKELYVGLNSNLTVNLTWVFDHHWPKLQVLSIGDTNVNGPIPNSISNATSLVSLYAQNCGINGSIPVSISNLLQLQHIDLSENSNLTGYPLSSISNLKNLRYLDLSKSNLQGSIPESICEIRCLQQLLLGGNKLNGTIPSCISKLGNLQKLDVNGNSIGGNISLISMINKLNLTFLRFDSNRITVEIDQYLLPSKFQLQDLVLSSCNLKGYIPVALICNMTHLFTLDLSHNNLTGVIPSCIFKLPYMSYLDLSNNNLQGTLPQSLSFATNFVQLDLSHNKLTGKISTQIGKVLSSIKLVYLNGNKLSGSIPFTICSKEDLQIHNEGFLYVLDLSNNNLSGTIPSTIEYCTSLQFLNLGMNNLRGMIPNELERVIHLQYLQLNGNNLTGSFPGYIQKLQYLEVLDLGNNNFEGSIPALIGSLYSLRILSLRSNRFNGSIPKEITHLSQLQFLDLSTNYLSGVIPLEMGNLEMLTSRLNNKILGSDTLSLRDPGVQLQIVTKGKIQYLEIVHAYNSGIDLSCNILEGQIPEEMGLLKGLAMLNLSHNRLVNKIPKSIGDMSSLESMDLSFNKLSGDIPQSLTHMDSLEILNLSYNNLSGRIPTGPHFDTLSVDGSAYTHNPLLCGILTKSCCKGDPGCSGDEDEDEDEDEEDGREKWLFSGVVILGFGVGFWGLFLVLLVKKEKWWFGYWRVVDIIAARILGCLSKN